MTATDSSTGSTETTSRPRSWPFRFYKSDIGKKYVMAITGIMGLGFIVFHMLGNLHAFEGAEQLDHYAEGLRDLGEPLAPRTFLVWILRIGLLASLALHLHAAFSLNVSNRRARGAQGYEGERVYLAASYASRTMIWSGVAVLLFLAYHLADLTIGIDAANPDFVRGNVYDNLIASLERWPVFLLYVAAQGALAFHIWHGAWSLFQSIGVNNPRFNHWRRNFATVLATVVALGFLTVPFGIMLGIIH